ncbi:FAD-dependent oxidoreductase [Alkalibacterium sp. 20]|uniref:FAD-dependent oxidoreductase n=1 Tax=Alkalibacterium sp. 20 TaxID=1798803 RepID=UPI0008FFF155|nr:FAD-dependent oxidoreductase [Alkalibacterium sp. 20]OJF92121.1 FAD-dependent oxidoreductase [Alkalibacterium sp. 20]
MKNSNTDVLVVGGSIGGCLAAYSAAKQKKKVILTEETDWIGGQLTSQGVPPDEHQWIEQTGCTATYRQFREQIRSYYRDHYPLTEEAMQDPLLNPGEAWVSRLSHEPKVALKVLENMLAPYINSGRIILLKGIKPVKAVVVDDKVREIKFFDSTKKEHRLVSFKAVVDATECGDVLPLANVEYVLGAEGREDTGETHASLEKDSQDMQSFTYVFAVDFVKNGHFIIEKPEDYDYWKTYIPPQHFNSLLNWHVGHQNDAGSVNTFTLFPDSSDNPALFTYRRAFSTALQQEKIYEGDVSLINWPQNDYFFGSIIDVSPEVREKHIHEAKQLSLSLLYWLQTEAPRDNDQKGYPELRLRKDVFDTEDGLAKYPYIRESRRIRAMYTIKEADVSIEDRKEAGIKEYQDSVGVGSYHLDLHTTVNSKTSMYIPTYPYEIPLRAIVPVRIRNLIPGCKNIGTTHITNGCYRLHPTEWNVGEAAGCLASFMIDQNKSVQEIAADNDLVYDFQVLLTNEGIQLHWPDDIKKEVLTPNRL